MSKSPGESYRSRLAARQMTVAALDRKDLRLSYLRLAIFLVGLGLAWASAVSDRLGWGWLALPIAAFLAVVLRHERLARERLRAGRAVDYYRRALDRLDDRWAGEGNAGERFIDARHPFSRDLDLFGRGSLFELLCAASTRGGEERLAGWLAEPAPPLEARRRQAAVEELRDGLDLREDLFVLGQEVGAAIDPGTLAAWGSSPRLLTERWAPWVALALGLGGYAAIGHWLMLPFWPSSAEMTLAEWLRELVAPVAVMMLVGGFALLFRRRVQAVLGGVDRPARELDLLARILARIEREQFQCPRLVEIRAALGGDGATPSRRIARLGRLVELSDSRRNVLFLVLSAPMLLGTQLAFGLERWRGASGTAVGRWLAAAGELEALGSLAMFAYEHPDDPFPELADEGPCFEARALGHPLLPISRGVRNDVTLGRERQLLLVSGSNMSGKSTLLRTVGINTVLALAGATVRAERLRISPLAVGACLRVEDSLRDGVSHFYAEITRLRTIVDLGTGPKPLLFLLDEILHGTNSHDRRIGAAAVIRGLLERGGIGLVTTHDLALARIAEELAPLAANVHFQDHLENGRMRFDYRLRNGVVTKSNALELMRSVGLKI